MSEFFEQIRIVNLGRVSYEEGQEQLNRAHSKVLGREDKAIVILQEFYPVVTCGKNVPQESKNQIVSDLFSEGICASVFPSDRGGLMTAHMPGQMVAYPVLPLGKWGVGVKTYIHLLEQTVIDLLAYYGIESCRDEGYPGVWVAKSKICALGVRVKQRISMHGLALNLNPDLRLFDSIVPCGIEGRAVCRASDYSTKLPAMDIVCRDFINELYKNLKRVTRMIDQ